MAQDSFCLFVVLGNTVELHVVPVPRTAQIVVAGLSYEMVSSENGFYDFLRDRKREIIGLRFTPFKDEPLLGYVAALNYVYVNRQHSFAEIYFRGDKRSETQLADQNFGDDALWSRREGIYALQVGLAYLEPSELSSLMEIVIK